MRLLPGLISFCALCGCGGGSGPGSNGTGLVTSSFGGSYTGGWSWPYHNENGIAAGTISSVGQVSIVENDTIASGSFYVTGSIGPGGRYSGSFEIGGVHESVDGSISPGLQGQTILAFPVTISGVSYLNRITLGASSPVSYAGDYNGTWNSPSAGEKGSSSFMIGQGGELVGSYTDATGAKTLLSGIVLGNGRFSGAIYSAGNYFNGTGSFTLSGEDLSGTLNFAASGNAVAVNFVMTRQTK